MSIHELMERYIEAFITHDVEAILTCTSPHCTIKLYDKITHTQHSYDARGFYEDLMGRTQNAGYVPEFYQAQLDFDWFYLMGHWLNHDTHDILMKTSALMIADEFGLIDHAAVIWMPKETEFDLSHLPHTR